MARNRGGAAAALLLLVAVCITAASSSAASVRHSRVTHHGRRHSLSSAHFAVYCVDDDIINASICSS